MNHFDNNSNDKSHDIINELFDLESYPLLPSVTTLMENTRNLLEFLFNNLQFKGCFSSKVKKMRTLSTASITSAIATLASICSCLIRSSVGDTYTLLRRYRDTLVQYLFILHTMKNYDPLRGHSLNDYNGQDMSAEKFMKMMIEYINALDAFGGDNRNDCENAVETWLDADALSRPGEKNTRREFFDYSQYINKLRDEPIIKECIDTYFSDDLEVLSRKFNDHTHINGETFARQNIQWYTRGNNEKYQKDVRECIEVITLTFLSILILIDSTVISSSDYMDAIEMDLTPISDSQYWVAPLVNDYLALYKDKRTMPLKKFLREKNNYSMQIE